MFSGGNYDPITAQKLCNLLLRRKEWRLTAPWAAEWAHRPHLPTVTPLLGRIILEMENSLPFIKLVL